MTKIANGYLSDGVVATLHETHNGIQVCLEQATDTLCYDDDGTLLGPSVPTAHIEAALGLPKGSIDTSSWSEGESTDTLVQVAWLRVHYTVEMEGTALDRRYVLQAHAAEAIRDACGWSEVYLSDREDDTVIAYPTIAALDWDLGTFNKRAPRIIRHTR